MLNLLHHHRVHIPNGLAIFAAILLLASTAIGYRASPSAYITDQETVTTAKIEASESDMGGEVTQKKHRSLNLGLLFFRR